jgi:hypothetical protein
LTIDRTSSSLVYLKNVTDETQLFTMSIEFPGGNYVAGLRSVIAGRTLVYDLKQLRDDQVPDEDGKKLPRDVTKGYLSWSARSTKNLVSGQMEGSENHVMIGRYEVADMGAGISSTGSYGCGCQPSYTDSWMEKLSNGTWVQLNNNPIDLDPGETVNLRGRELDEDCGGPSYHVGAANFGSEHPSVATVNTATGVVTAVDGGDSTVTAHWAAAIFYPLYDCCEYLSWDPDPPAQIHVRPPTISSITPARGLIGNNTSVTLSGQRFKSGQTLSAGTGITVTINSINSTTITATLAVSENATGGNHDMNLTTPGGASSNTQQFYVQIPNAFLPLSVASADGHCGSSSQGYAVKITYQVVDQEDPAVPIAVAGLIPEEIVTSPSGGFSDYRSFATPTGTDANGIFFDVPVVSCFSPHDQNYCVAVKQEFRLKIPRASPSTDLFFFLGTQNNRIDAVLGQKSVITTGTLSNTLTSGTVAQCHQLF